MLYLSYQQVFRVEKSERDIRSKCQECFKLPWHQFKGKKENISHNKRGLFLVFLSLVFAQLVSEPHSDRT